MNVKPRGGSTAAPPVPRSDRGSRWIGVGIIALAFGVFGGWAALAELDGAAVAPAVVQVDSYRQAVEHLDGGQVDTIHVRDGDSVAAGEILVELDATEVRAELETVRSQHAAARAERLRLEAERDERDTIATLIPQPQDAADQHFARSLAAQQAIFNTRRESFQAEVDLLRERAQALRAQIRGLEAVVEARREMRAQYEEELDELSGLVQEQLMDRRRARELERLIVENRGDIAELEADISRLRVEITETELHVAQRRSERQAEIADRLNEVEQRFHNLDEQRHALERRAARTTVRAPATGVIVNLDIHTEGAVIEPGHRIAEIVPTDAELVVEARVRPEDIDRVRMGQLADVRLTAYSYRMTPVLVGDVIHISADRLEDENTGEAYYLARVYIDESARRFAIGDEPLLPGMPAEVMIRTGERSLLSYLLRPLSDALSRAFRE
ncbi:HlyD family type I secretion periplasmic adaptor subunit [Aquisalimonas sp.]|uniref:HlyD family type I secretion periplasmic adaptor subunit n=1 Tax=Aquisalimonas sp. TaxID=1872621 RepID=UPI0025B87A62|nr:HlyD family type I secretion periplasmic adaptor subunit [Aquisalimonas sp.]